MEHPQCRKAKVSVGELSFPNTWHQFRTLPGMSLGSSRLYDHIALASEIRVSLLLGFLEHAMICRRAMDATR